LSLTTREQEILGSIVVASENDPLRPEFPADNPKFPATPTIQIDVPGFDDVWLKDESHNPTGTHKDRMAWEIVVTYRDFLMAKQNDQLTGPLPTLSIISSGSAAIAIQAQLLRYQLPNLKVLVDASLAPERLDALRKLGCEIYQTDLSRKPFSWQEILAITDNVGGFDITSSEALDPTTRFYDWLSYEIINSSPAYCFIPFGTGNLFENILNTNKKEVSTTNHDPRFEGDIKTLRKCSFLGATTSNPRSKADKLYSAHLPFVHFDEQWIRLYRYAGFCGPLSNVYPIQEQSLNAAIELAEAQSVSCEPSGIAGLALLLQMKGDLDASAKMLVVNTGNTKYS
jgi:hypothetical protein